MVIISYLKRACIIVIILIIMYNEQKLYEMIRSGAMFLFSKKNINKGFKEYKKKKGAVLIDVRKASEFKKGHLPGAVNIPLKKIKKISLEKDVPLFVYCYRGRRSGKAVKALEKLGYENVKSIGGIKKYKGELEK